MFCWTETMVRFMQDAAENSPYQRELAQWICSQLPQARHVCDAGCGLGFLSLELADRFPEVTAADVSQQALDEFAYEVKKYIGAYAAALEGLDCLVFTAGVGENSASMRASICEGLEFLGVKIDPEKNKTRGEEVIISTPDSKVTVWVIPTNEELMIAQDTAALTR